MAAGIRLLRDRLRRTDAAGPRARLPLAPRLAPLHRGKGEAWSGARMAGRSHAGRRSPDQGRDARQRSAVAIGWPAGGEVLSLSVWALPGPVAFIARIADALRAGASVVLAMPRWAPRGVHGALRAALGAGWERVPLQAVRDAPPSAQVLARLLPSAAGDVVPSARRVAEVAGGGRFIVVLGGLEASVWPSWRDFLAEYAGACAERAPHLRPRLVAVADGITVADLTERAGSLEIHPWNGVVGGLDMLLYTAHRFAGRTEAGTDLLAAVGARVALWDPAVADLLAARPASEVLEPVGALRELAASRGWSSADEPAWERGTLAMVDGQMQVHSALLAARGEERALRTRVWSGQAGVLLPLVEQRRRDVVERVRSLLTLPFDTGYGVIADARDLEVSHLAFLLRGQRVPPRLRDLVERLRRIRNLLAHFEPVAPDDALDPEVYGGAGV